MRKMGSMRVRLAAMLAVAMMASAAPASVVNSAPESPGTALSRHIRVLASNPRDFNALVGAGRAALDLGDIEAAAGFFGRAEEVNPNAPAAKIGLGAAMAHMGDADGAIFYFNQAARLGASPIAMATDRGMARDLLGDLASAQSDYRIAIASLGSDEARRRLALSLAIGRDKAGALAAIQPLLNRRDPAAQRTRAFVLALVGDRVAAAQAIEAVMPGASARFEPFFRYLPNLSAREKAAAVHLGVFPDNAATRVAQAAPPPAVAALPPARQPAVGGPAASRSAVPTPVPSRPVQLAENKPLPAPPSVASPSFSLPSARSGPQTGPGSSPAPAPAGTALADASAAATPPAASPAFSLSDLPEGEGNLSGIDKLLATMAEAPPPPQPKLELKKPVVAGDSKSAKAAKAAADKKAAEKKVREEKLAVEKKAKAEAAKLGVSGTHWVQLAGGSNQDRMASEYRRLSAKAGKLLKSRSGYVTEGKDYFRLLVGPFESKGESQAFVNKLAKEGIDGFSWTRTPPKIKIEKL